MRSFVLLAIGELSLLTPVLGTSMLFNGQQDEFFPLNTPNSCLAAFNTSLDCDDRDHLLYKQTDWVGWNGTDLTALCTSSCNSSITSLKSAVDSACASTVFMLGGTDMDSPTLIDAILYHYEIACMTDGSTFGHLQL